MKPFTDPNTNKAAPTVEMPLRPRTNTTPTSSTDPKIDETAHTMELALRPRSGAPASHQSNTSPPSPTQQINSERITQLERQLAESTKREEQLKKREEQLKKREESIKFYERELWKKNATIKTRKTTTVKKNYDLLTPIIKELWAGLADADAEAMTENEYEAWKDVVAEDELVMNVQFGVEEWEAVKARVRAAAAEDEIEMEDDGDRARRNPLMNMDDEEWQALKAKVKAEHEEKEAKARAKAEEKAAKARAKAERKARAQGGSRG